MDHALGRSDLDPIFNLSPERMKIVDFRNGSNQRVNGSSLNCLLYYYLMGF